MVWIERQHVNGARRVDSQKKVMRHNPLVIFLYSLLSGTALPNTHAMIHDQHGTVIKKHKDTLSLCPEDVSEEPRVQCSCRIAVSADTWQAVSGRLARVRVGI